LTGSCNRRCSRDGGGCELEQDMARMRFYYWRAGGSKWVPSRTGAACRRNARKASPARIANRFQRRTGPARSPDYRLRLDLFLRLNINF